MWSLIKRHAEILGIVLTVIIPIILRSRIRPVIFCKYSGIGDIICTFPAALELKKRHPQATFIYNCHAGYACLPKLGGVATVVTTTPHIGLLGYWYKSLLSGFYDFASDDDKPNVVPKDVYIKDFGHQFGLEVDDAHPQLKNNPEVVQRVRTILDKDGAREGSLILIHTGPSWPVREWPHESWTKLVQEFRGQGRTNIVRLGTSNHIAMGAENSKVIPGVLSLVDQLSLEETAALIELCDLFIGIDSGLLHIAACLGKPAVGLWGATSPQFRFSSANRRFFVISPVECQGCHHRVPREHWITGCPFDIKCMKELQVAEVLDQSLRALKSNPKNE